MAVVGQALPADGDLRRIEVAVRNRDQHATQSMAPMTSAWRNSRPRDLLGLGNRDPVRRPVPGGKDGDMADQPLDASTRLAVERTRLANERTLMAWIRTSTS